MQFHFDFFSSLRFSQNIINRVIIQITDIDDDDDDDFDFYSTQSCKLDILDAFSSSLIAEPRIFV